MSTRQMIDAIRKGDRLGHKAMQEIADELERLRSERDEALTVAWTIRGFMRSETFTACMSGIERLWQAKGYGGNVDD